MEHLNSIKPATLFLQLLYISAASYQTLAPQWLFYQGAANQTTLLTVFTTYLGMALVYRKHHSINRPRLLMIMLLDILASIVSTTGLFFVGSGVFQVIYSSVVIFTAILRRYFLNRTINKYQWIAITTIVFGLSFGSRQSLTNQTSSTFIGVFLSLLGTIMYACIYVSTEYALTLMEPRPQPEEICSCMGIYASLLCGVYVCVYTIPNFNSVFVQPVNDKNGNGVAIVLIYASMLVGAYVHNVSYFRLIGTTGSVSTGVLQGIRAVIVFISSGILYCGIDVNQCMTVDKAIGMILVVCGVVGFSVALIYNPQHIPLPLKDISANRHQQPQTV